MASTTPSASRFSTCAGAHEGVSPRFAARRTATSTSMWSSSPGFELCWRLATAPDSTGISVELMARDGGHLPAPSVGDAISLVGAWVKDTQHGWNELHPVWSIALNGGRVSHSGPQFGGTPAADRSENAGEDCRTNGGRRCPGYGPTPSREASPSPRVRRHSGSSAESSSGGGCAAGYSPCLPAAGDLDCGDIPSNKKPVRVTGGDPYGLDRDGGGVGCDSG